MSGQQARRLLYASKQSWLAVCLPGAHRAVRPVGGASSIGIWDLGFGLNGGRGCTGIRVTVTVQLQLQ